MIQFGGLASGLDTNAIIEAILNAERVPIQQLESDRTVEERKISLLGTLEGHVKALRDKAEELSTLSGFQSHLVTPSEEGVASFSVTGTPLEGSHTLTVNSLASASRFTFTDTVTDPDADLGAGDISFNIDGTAYNVSLTADGSSLNEIRDELNSLAGDDITASVVNIGTDSSPQYQLVIAGNDTGIENALTGLTSTVAGLTDANIEELTSASNAQVVVDGLTVERATNVFDGVIEGISFTAQAADVNKEISFSTALDTEGIQTRLGEFVDAYNEVIGFLNDQAEFDTEESEASSELFGDPLLRNVRQTLSSALFNVDIATVQADTAGFSTLSLVGIDLQSDGTLSIDETQLAEKLAEDPDLFADLFVDTDGFDNGGATANTTDYFVDTTSDDGLLDNLFRAIDRIVDEVELADGSTIKSLFDLREDTFRANVDRINDRIEVLERRLEDTETSLIRQFTALEEVVAGLNAQQGFLNGIATQQ